MFYNLPRITARYGTYWGNNGSANETFLMQIWPDGSGRIGSSYIGGQSILPTTLSITQNVKLDIIADLTLGQMSYTVNQVSTPKYNKTATINNKLYILAAHGNSSSGNTIDCFQVGRIYYYQLYQDGRLEMKLIPALDTNGRPCMYDLVSKQPFYNSGTGEFLYKLK